MKSHEFKNIDKWRRSVDRRNKRIVDRVQQAVANGIRVTFSAESTKTETKTAKILRRSTNE